MKSRHVRWLRLLLGVWFLAVSYVFICEQFLQCNVIIFLDSAGCQHIGFLCRSLTQKGSDSGIPFRYTSSLKADSSQ